MSARLRRALLGPLAALSCLACLGCGHVSGHHYLVEVDPAFSPSEVEAIQDAALSWEAAVDGLELPLVIARCAGVHEATICLHASTPAEVTSLAGTSAAAGHTAWNDVGGETWMRVPGSSRFQQEVAHEMGHAMGLEHDREDTLMYFSVSGESERPTSKDVAQWRAVRDL